MFRRSGALVAALVLVAIAVRLLASHAFAAAPTSHDPDGYVQLARELADGTRPWHWTMRAVSWIEFYKAPLYQVVLSAFTAYPSLFPLPQSALILHALFDGATVWALYTLGVALHSRRAGLIAAAAYALWVPNILVTSTYWQEHLFNPLLVVGLALLARAIDTQQRLRSWAIAGVVFGLCALSRSAILYFIPLAAICYVLAMPKTRTVFRQAGAFAGGFVVTVVPYIVFISLSIGRFMPIEDSGAVQLRRSPPPNPNVALTHYMTDQNRGTTGGEVVRYLIADFTADPGGFTARHYDFVRLLLKPASGALLTHMNTETPAAASMWKGAIHLGVDVPFVAAALLCAFGVVVSRNRAVAIVLAAFAVQYLLILALTNWAGTRYRSPIEPILLALAAAALAGQYRAVSRKAIAGAVVVTILIAIVIAQSGGATLRARANYGVGDWELTTQTEMRFDGRAGANVVSPTSTLAFTLEAQQGGRPSDAITVTVRVDGRTVDTLTMMAGQPRQVRCPIPAPGAVYLELTATSADGTPVPMRVSI